MTQFTWAAGITIGMVSMWLGAAVNAQDAPRITHIDDAASMEIAPMDTPGVNAFLQDVVGADNPDKPITCGFFRLEASAEPLVYTYDYDETKLILEGEITVSDGTNSFDAIEGDVLLLPKGATVTFTTKTAGKAYVCGARLRDTA